MKRQSITRSNTFRFIALAFVALLAVAAVVFVWIPDDEITSARTVSGGNPELGKQALTHFGCIACHSVPGVRGPDAYVGPPLDHWNQRRYIAGRRANEVGNLIEWIQYPQAIDPETAMPTLGVSEEDARHIAAYLYSLE